MTETKNVFVYLAAFFIRWMLLQPMILHLLKMSLVYYCLSKLFLLLSLSCKWFILVFNTPIIKYIFGCLKTRTDKRYHFWPYTKNKAPLKRPSNTLIYKYGWILLKIRIWYYINIKRNSIIRRKRRHNHKGNPVTICANSISGQCQYLHQLHLCNWHQDISLCIW